MQSIFLEITEITDDKVNSNETTKHKAVVRNALAGGGNFIPDSDQVGPPIKGQPVVVRAALPQEMGYAMYKLMTGKDATGPVRIVLEPTEAIGVVTL